MRLRISVQAAKARADADEAISLDVVAQHSSEEMPSAIEGTVRIDPAEIEQYYQTLPRDKDVIAYCTCDREQTSARMALFLREQGYRAYPLEGGFSSWQNAGYPVENKAAEATV